MFYHRVFFWYFIKTLVTVWTFLINDIINDNKENKINDKNLDSFKTKHYIYV